MAYRGWQRPARGVVFTRPDPLTRDDWIQVGLALAGSGAALSGWDAVRLRGVGAATAPNPRALVLTRTGNQQQTDGVLVRLTSRPYRTTLLPAAHPTLPFVPVVHPARAVCDTALMYRTYAPVRVLVTSTIQRKLCTPADLVTEYRSGPRGRSHWLRESLQDVLVNAHSIAEAEAADALRVAHVPSFELNVDIVDRTGRLLATADVLWRSLRAVGEIQSRAFHFDEESWNATMTRHNRLTARALAVAHWPPSAIRQGGRAWAMDVAAWLRARAAEIGASYVPGNGALLAPSNGPAPFVVS